MGGLLVAQLLVAAAGDIPERVQVHLAGERVSVRAEAAPLSQVLDSLAQRTGMKVLWERNLGRPNVSAVLEDCTPAEAVVRLLQGSGFNYALATDPSGTRVEMLIIVGVPFPEPPRPGFVQPRRAEPSTAAPGPGAEELPEDDPASEVGQPGGEDTESSQPGPPAVPAPAAASPSVPPSMPGPPPANGPPH